MKVMQFSITAEKSIPAIDQLGGRYFVVGLCDGREVSLWAAWMVVNSGCVEFRDSKDELLLALPPGSWVHAYAASIADGAPVMVERLVAP
jgi:hypothetical protein